MVDPYRPQKASQGFSHLKFVAKDQVEGREGFCLGTL